jgi:hypothetical protein
MLSYGFLDRALHRLALQSTPIAELSFDIDQRLVRADPAEIVDQQHVFVSGLARAGTTALMRRFHATGAFRSLTYRDMPFVLAPNFWQRLARLSPQEIAKVERTHGDGILVDLDSPESLDEVFWRIFAGAEYIKKTHLRPHTPDEETVSKFILYVNSVLAAREPRGMRYLSKNNNNILRLASIRQAFPNALILIPFRRPLDHAASLLRQHRHLSLLQAEDGFITSYMTWLAHHEFGLTHRPFRFHDDGSFVPSAHATSTIDYWLEVWCETYGWLEAFTPEGAVFVCYEELCDDSRVWNRLAEVAGIAASADEGEPFQPNPVLSKIASDSTLAEKALALYASLAKRAHPSRRT